MLLGIREAVRARWIVTIVLRFIFALVTLTALLSLVAAFSAWRANGHFGLALVSLPLLQLLLGVVGFVFADYFAAALVPLHYRCPKCSRPLSLAKAHAFCPGCDLPLDGPSSK